MFVAINETIADNEGWRRGYGQAVTAVLNEIGAEMRWQTELRMRGDHHADTVINRLMVLKNIIQDWGAP